MFIKYNFNADLKQVSLSSVKLKYSWEIFTYVS